MANVSLENRTILIKVSVPSAKNSIRPSVPVERVRVKGELRRGLVCVAPPAEDIVEALDLGDGKAVILKLPAVALLSCGAATISSSFRTVSGSGSYVPRDMMALSYTLTEFFQQCTQGAKRKTKNKSHKAEQERGDRCLVYNHSLDDSG
jgi:hypothetical protein